MNNPYLHAIENTDFFPRYGKITAVNSIFLEASGPKVALGERCEIESISQNRPVLAEVIALKAESIVLMPYQHPQGIAQGAKVKACGRKTEIGVGSGLLGRIIDTFGNPLDGKGKIITEENYPLYRQPTNPLQRPRINEVFETHIKAIDSALTVGIGQRMGIFAGSGVGKSTLLGMIARNSVADVNVIAMVGERGREVRDFIEGVLGDEGLKKSVVVVASSDQSALSRTHAAFTATAIAEYFSDRGLQVALTIDSLTRIAMAQREIGLALGEPPTARGYTPSVFALLPQLLERCGKFNSQGSITGFFTVLVEGDDMNDPMADTLRAILDGIIVLDRALWHECQYPPIDLLQSNSRLFRQIANEADIALIENLLRLLSTYQHSKDLLDLGAYQKGNNPQLDQALRLMPKIKNFLAQKADSAVSRAAAYRDLKAIFTSGDTTRIDDTSVKGLKR